MRYCVPLFFVVLLLLFVLTRKFSFTDKSKIEDEVCESYGAKPWDIPWQVYIVGVSTSKNITTTCGGSLITSNAILTSASCLNVFDNFTVQFGTFIDRPISVQQLNRSNVYKHPRYRDTKFNHDIAIVKLNLDIPFSNQLQPVLLPRKSQAVVDYYKTSYAILSGWGVQYKDELEIKCLMSVMGRVLSNDQCSSMVDYSMLPESVICSYGIGSHAGNSACVGDNGGPLVTFENNPTELYTSMVLIGVQSLGYTKCSSSDPTGYTATAFYLDWIANVTGLKIRN